MQSIFPQSEDQTKNSIDQHLASLEKDFQDFLKTKKAFNSSIVTNEIQSDLERLQSYIMRLSENCLTQLNEWNNGLSRMDNEINEVSGTIQKVKSDVGSRLLNEYIKTPNAPVDIDDFSINSQKISIDFTKNVDIPNPQFPFCINSTVTENLGLHIGKPETMNRPLLVVIPKGQASPEFWSESSDFFSPLNQKPDQAVATSFSRFYNFSSS